MEITPFTILNSINQGLKGDHLLEDTKADGSTNPSSIEKQYVPFIINRGLSYFSETVLFANEMNYHHHLPPRMQYDFLRTAILPRKRFSKWNKPQKKIDDVQLIQDAYSYSKEKAESAYKLFTSEAIDELRQRFDKGGLAKSKGKK